MAADTPVADKYAAGCLLCVIWGSLCWSDALWVSASSVQVYSLTRVAGKNQDCQNTAASLPPAC